MTENALEQARQAILLQLLADVPFDGWTDSSIEKAALAAGYDALTGYRAFPLGVGQAVEAFSLYIDQEMERRMQGHPRWLQWRMTEKVIQSIIARLETMAPYRETVRRTLAYYTLHPLQGSKRMCTTVDAVWRLAGDRASDYNFYTKRSLLAGVYAATLSYWLEDTSENFTETQGFLRRRIADVMKIPQLKQKLKEGYQKMARAL